MSRSSDSRRLYFLFPRIPVTQPAESSLSIRSLEEPSAEPLQTSSKEAEPTIIKTEGPSDSASSVPEEGSSTSGRLFVHFSADTRPSLPTNHATQSLPKRRLSAQYSGAPQSQPPTSTGAREHYHHPHPHQPHAISASSVATAPASSTQRYHRSRSISHPYTSQTAPARHHPDLGELADLRAASSMPGSASPEYKTQWIFWYAAGAKKPAGGLSREDYMNALIREGSFNQPTDVMEVCDRVFQATDSAAYRTFHLFKKGIKPVWEDPRNASGGKWVITCPSGPSSYGSGGRRHSIASAAASSENSRALGHARALEWWKTIILAMIAGRLGYKKQICGVMLSLQPWGGAVISLWNSNASDAKQIAAIKAKLKRLLARHAAAAGLSTAGGAELNIKYQPHHPGGAAAAGVSTMSTGAGAEAEPAGTAQRRSRSKSDPWPLLAAATRRASTSGSVDVDHWFTAGAAARPQAGPSAGPAAVAGEEFANMATRMRRPSFSKRLEVFENIASEEEEEVEGEHPAYMRGEKGFGEHAEDEKAQPPLLPKDILGEDLMDKEQAGAQPQAQETLAVTSATPPPVVVAFSPIPIGKPLAKPPAAAEPSRAAAFHGNGTAAYKDQLESGSDPSQPSHSLTRLSPQTLSAPGSVRGGGGSAPPELVSRGGPRTAQVQGPLESPQLARLAASPPPSPSREADTAEERVVVLPEKEKQAEQQPTSIEGQRTGWLLPLLTKHDVAHTRHAAVHTSRRVFLALLAMSAVVSVCAVAYLAYYGSGSSGRAEEKGLRGRP